MAKTTVEAERHEPTAEVRVLADLVFVYVAGALSGYGMVRPATASFVWVREPSLSERRREEAETLAMSLAMRPTPVSRIAIAPLARATSAPPVALMS